MDKKIIINNKEVNLDTIKVDGVHHWDYPEFSDAFVSFATFVDGKTLSPRQLDIITDNYPELINDLAHQINT
jgi:hypothetical protein|tara:strand:- start:1335 stop:1550 length:216 start_codon:yes stop_codon:yes gene_type:complete